MYKVHLLLTDNDMQQHPSGLTWGFQNCRTPEPPKLYFANEQGQRRPCILSPKQHFAK